jgi:hypothetical protein
MRTFTGIHEDRLLGVVPGDKLEEFLASLGTAVEANKTMRSFYSEHRAKFPLLPVL